MPVARRWGEIPWDGNIPPIWWAPGIFPSGSTPFTGNGRDKWLRRNRGITRSSNDGSSQAIYEIDTRKTRRKWETGER